MSSANRWVTVREAPRGGPQTDDLFMARQQPCVPASRLVIAAGAEVPLALMGYDLGAGGPPGHPGCSPPTARRGPPARRS